MDERAQPRITKFSAFFGNSRVLEVRSRYKVPELNSKTRFQMDKRGKVGLLTGVG